MASFSRDSFDINKIRLTKQLVSSCIEGNLL